MTRKFRFTGWHMLASLVLFFGTVIAVNITMATFATRTFGGVVVKNSYVASQKFNGWLAEARAQEQLGWKAALRSVDRRMTVDAVAPEGAVVTATARHPLGRMPDIAVRFTQVSIGRYVAQKQLPAGRWRVHLRVTQGGRTADFVQDVTA